MACLQYIMNVINNLIKSWREVKIYPDCIRDFLGFEEQVRNVHQEIVGLANRVGFNEDDVVELL